MVSNKGGTRALFKSRMDSVSNLVVMRPCWYSSGDASQPRQCSHAQTPNTCETGQEKTSSTVQGIGHASLPRLKLCSVPRHGYNDPLGVSPVAIAEHLRAVFDLLYQTPGSHIVLGGHGASTGLRRGASGGRSRSRDRTRVMSGSGRKRESHRGGLGWVTGVCWLGRANVSVSVQTAP